MTDKQINAAIAEACGWKLEKHFWLTPEGCEAYGWDIPNYCNDLNEMHLAESILTTDQYMRFSDLLYDAEQERLKQTKRWRWLSVTARQRAEAFLRTLGKWDQSGDATEMEVQK